MGNTETDEFISQFGKEAIVHYQPTLKGKDVDENRVLKNLNYFVSKGADVNAKTEGKTPLDIAKEGRTQTQRL